MNRPSRLFICPSPTPLRVDCAWCNATMSPGREPVTHGICAECEKQYFPEKDSES
jgi:hypothetical protein